MRITGGEARGKRLFVPAMCRVRPTSDMVRAALFNILPPLRGTSFVDLFAGTGSVGLEALSRGASPVVFIERQPVLVEAIRKNILQSRLAGDSSVLLVDALVGLKRLFAQSAPWDILFADPPYGDPILREILREIAREGGGMIREAGQLVVQHSIHDSVDDGLPGCFRRENRKQYGDTVLTFFRIPTPEEAG